MSEKIKVIYIIGYGHSGSTLLDIILGNQNGIASVGELVHFDPLPDTGTIPCSCGLTQVQCSYWQQVTSRFKRQLSDDRAFTLTALNIRFDRWRSVRCWMRLNRQRERPSSDYRKYCRYLIALFKAISEVSGRSTIVDSSKNPCRALTLASLSSAIDLRALHLVRDGRAVCWSMMKKRQRTNGRPLSQKQQLIAFLRTMIGWMAINIIAERVCKGKIGEGSLRIRYEDLFEGYQEFFSRISAMTDENMNEPLAAIGSGAELKIGHMVAGNRLRLNNKVVLKPDNEWREKLPPFYKRVFRIFGGWALKRYGFPTD